MQKAKLSMMSIFLAAIAVLATSFFAGQSQAAKPETLDPVTLTFTGGEVEGTAPSFGGVKRSSKRGNVLVEIVVRGMPFSVPAAIGNTTDGDICFVDPDTLEPDVAPTAGKLTLYSDGTADFDLYPEFRTDEGELQSYNFFFESHHAIALTGNPVLGEVTLMTMDIDTEGRGKKPKSCRGTVLLSDTYVLIE
jgi:hypothetical protein